MTDTPDPAAAATAVATSAVRAMIDQWLSLSNAVAAGTLGPIGGVPPTVADTVGKLLGAVNLPTRADVLAVGAAVAALDARLARLEAALAPTRNDERSPAATSRSTTMADLSQIKEHANIIGADGVHVGTVDHVDGDRIKLTKTDSGDHRHHWISGGLVAGIEGNDVRLSANADVAVTFEEDE